MIYTRAEAERGQDYAARKYSDVVTPMSEILTRGDVKRLENLLNK